MCSHHNIVNDEYGSTCVDCSVHFNKGFCSSDFTLNYNGPSVNLLKTKSSIVTTLENEFGIKDPKTIQLTEKIFKNASQNKMVKGTNKRSILCASLFYAYFYLKNPKDFKEILNLFNLTHKNGMKGLKMCQISLQECPIKEVKVKDQIHSFSSSHTQKLKELIKKYNISLNHYDAIEKIIVEGHLKKNKLLNDRINNLWISCIFFWIIKINPYMDPEEFVSINSDYTTLSQLKSDLTYLRKNLE